MARSSRSVIGIVDEGREIPKVNPKSRPGDFILGSVCPIQTMEVMVFVMVKNCHAGWLCAFVSRPTIR
jgi:hypothetical protein